jgi:hypothetical protein
LDNGFDFPNTINELKISARLFVDSYESGNKGMFVINISNLKLMSDGTKINTADTVIGHLRYYVSGSVSCEVYSSFDEEL